MATVPTSDDPYAPLRAEIAATLDQLDRCAEVYAAHVTAELVDVAEVRSVLDELTGTSVRLSGVLAGLGEPAPKRPVFRSILGGLGGGRR